MSLSHLSRVLDYNLSTLHRQPWSEFSGALGDLGTFLPILIALAEGHQISLSTSLIFSGVYNIATGALFGIPLPVQPMKAIAAVAILRGLSAGEVAAAGIFVSTCILVFSITGLLRWFTSVVPVPVVKGIQVGAGLSLVIAAGSSVQSKLSWIKPSWADNYLWVIVAFLALFLLNVRPRAPYALLTTLTGVTFAVVQIGITKHGSFPSVHAWRPYTQVPTGDQWRTGIVDAGIGQLPLTTLNSIVAVTSLAADLLPEVATPSVTSIGLSVAAMNLVGCWFGAMPVCHGSGGLAAQHRFGARSGASIILLGLLKLLLGLLFGESLTYLLKEFPTAFLSVMIIAAGLELASVGESLNTTQAKDIQMREDNEQHANALNSVQRKRRWTVMMVTAGTLIAFKNDAVGFLAGLCCHFSLKLADHMEARRSRLWDESQPLLS